MAWKNARVNEIEAWRRTEKVERKSRQASTQAATKNRGRWLHVPQGGTEKPKQDHQKLVVVSEGPEKVTDVEKHTVGIEKPYNSFKRVSRSRVVLEFRPKSIEYVQKTIKQLLYSERDVGYPVPEAVNKSDDTEQGSASDKTVKEDERKEVTNDAKEEQENEKKDPRNNAKQNADEKRESSDESKNTSILRETQDEVETEKLEMDKIVYHKVNKAIKQPTTRKGQTLYRVRWFYYSNDDDTQKPIEKLTEGNFLSKQLLKKLQPLDNIDKEIVGWYASANKKYYPTWNS